jgi:alpha-aminoadipic semialdehyde synthase
MPHAIGIRRETKTPWERRAPITPELARRLVEDVGLTVLVQPSARRVYHDKEYVRAGAVTASNLSEADVILGVKEIPPDALEANKTYVFFSHVIKGQPANMPMLARMMELGCTLIDYEKITDNNGQRLIFFGRFAGLAGTIDALWALGQRFAWEGSTTPFAAIEPAHSYPSLEEARAAVSTAGEAISSDGVPPPFAPVVIGIAGYGNVAQGAREILSDLPTREVAPEALHDVTAEAFRHSVVVVTFREEHLVAPNRAEDLFELQDYYDHPDKYRSTFAPLLPHLTVLMNCTYWDHRYPKLVTKDDLRKLYAAGRHRLRVIGDLSCDIEGAVECTVKCTEPGDPVYVWNPASGETSSGVEGEGPIILAVDILPAELPLEASEEFSRTLAPFVPALARADFTVELDRLQLPDQLRRAVIVHRGELTSDYSYLKAHLTG